MLESRAERSAPGAAPDVAVVDVGLSFMSPKTYLTAESHTSKKRMTRASSHKKPISILHERVLFLRPDQNLKLGIGSA